MRKKPVVKVFRVALYLKDLEGEIAYYVRLSGVPLAEQVRRWLHLYWKTDEPFKSYPPYVKEIKID